MHISGEESLVESVLTSLTAKRRLRVIIATYTTHSKYPIYWLQLLNHISSTVQNCMNILVEFQRLDKKDKEILLKNENLKNFIYSSFQIAELSVWVSASCIECMIHEETANRYIYVCFLSILFILYIHILICIYMCKCLHKCKYFCFFLGV
jgi:septum formation topological specificity factor MinE